MAMVWAAFLACSFLCTASQNIYLRENTRWTIYGETMMEIRELLIQQEQIQKSVDSLGQMVKKLEEDVTKTKEDVQIVKRATVFPKDCKDLKSDGNTNSGVFYIYPYGTTSPVTVYCDMTTMGGGWTAIQKRITGSLDFDRTWTEYKNGFGSPEQEVWVGNELIHVMTKENSSLYVSITLLNGKTLYEIYDRFSVSDEAGLYQLFLAGPATGTLGDSMLDSGSSRKDLSGMYFSTPDRDNDIYCDSLLETGSSNKDLSGMYFSTPDRDNDRYRGGNCAAFSDRRGGWWFNSCHLAFLNGPWSPESWEYPWYPTVWSGTSVKGTTMMIRRH